MATLYAFKGSALKDEFHGVEALDIPDNYAPYQVFVLGENAKDAENMVLDGMDAGPWGNYGTWTVEPCEVSDIDSQSIEFMRLMTKDRDGDSLPAVHMMAEILGMVDSQSTG